MSFKPIILRSHLTLAGVDVSRQIREFRITGVVDVVDEPPSGTNGEWGRKLAGARWSITLVYMSSFHADSIAHQLWDAFGDPAGVAWSGRLDKGAIGELNPQWAGTLLVSQWGVGGSVSQRLATDSVTFPLTGKPTRTDTP